MTTDELTAIIADEAITMDTDLDGLADTAARVDDAQLVAALHDHRPALDAIVREQGLVNVDRGQ